VPPRHGPPQGAIKANRKARSTLERMWAMRGLSLPIWIKHPRADATTETHP